MSMAVACALLVIVSEKGAAAQTVPAPAVSQPPAPTAAAPAPAIPDGPTAEEIIVALKKAMNAKDHVIAQLIEAGALCRDMLTDAESAQVAAKKKADAPAKPKDPGHP